jgi:hypothetical protein
MSMEKRMSLIAHDCALTMPVCVVNISRKWFKMPKRTVGLFSFFKSFLKRLSQIIIC